MLRCYNNRLTSLNISQNINLTRLRCYNNQLTSLDVSKSTSLTSLICSNNQLTNLYTSKNTALTELYCNNNLLTSLEAGPSLTYLICSGNLLTSLDVSKSTALTTLHCKKNQLPKLDTSKNTALTMLFCSANLLTSLKLNAPVLNTLSCESNQLTSLDVSVSTALISLYCESNQLTSLDVSVSTALIRLYCKSNQLTSLDASANTALAILSCESNQLTTLDVSVNTTLAILSCESNQLTSLDVSANTTLITLLCNNNQLTILNVKNGNNRNFRDNAQMADYFNTTGNENLTCIQVDDASYSTANWTNIDKNTTFNEDCGNGDIDGDSVADKIDQCGNTPSGVAVNTVGCVQVLSNNFEIFSTTPKCPNINKGKISIKNLSSYMFDFIVTGPDSYNETFENKLANEPFVIEDLSVGTYNITAKFSTDEIGKDIIGFQVAVNGATPVSGTNKSVNKLRKSSVFTVSGDKKYSIYVNDVFQRSETFSDENEYDITVENLSTGKNHIKIVPENICRGLIEDWIIIPNSNIIFYPNPIVDLFHIGGLESSGINVRVFAYNGQLRYNKNHKSVNGIVYFSTRDLSTGLYIVRVSGEKTEDNINFKITKK